jgi:hypothetical protein
VSRGSRGALILPVLLSSAVILGGVFSGSSLRDAVTGATPAGAELAVSPSYVFLSPFSRVVDTIGLLSTGQHVALGLTVIALTALWASTRRRPVLVAGAISLGVLLVLYACAAALPRPMAALVVRDSDVVLVDFHSHTNASGDARSGFSPEDNRAWHERGGFDVAYISDHRSFDGAEAARSRNHQRAGDRVVLLSAFEGRYLGTFEIFLSFTRPDSTTLMDGHRRLLEGRLLSGRLPASVVALPSPLIDVQAVARDGPPHIAAIEISDGSPRGFAQSDRDRSEIVRRADSLGIALVSGSNNHGWGRVVAAWTLVRIPGWRRLGADSLGAAIEGALRAAPRGVRVVERTRPVLASPAALALTVPVLGAQLFSSLTIPERVVWLGWIWGIAGVALLRVRSRRNRLH